MMGDEYSIRNMRASREQYKAPGAGSARDSLRHWTRSGGSQRLLVTLATAEATLRTQVIGCDL